MMRSLIVVICGAIAAVVVIANCPPGTTATDTGDIWCGWSTQYGFNCWNEVECVNPCAPWDCAAKGLPTTPTKSTRIRKLPDGKLEITRLVVHTESDIKGPHMWITKNLDVPLSPTIAVPMPLKIMLGAKTKAHIDLLESALAEQLASNCCKASPKK